MAKNELTHEHRGHRERMKRRMLRETIEHMAGHEVIELLLYYAVPYRDTNPLAHRLITKFGSVHRVLAADYADLLKVEGVTPHIATLLVMCGQLTFRCLQEAYDPGTQLCDNEDYVPFLLPWFAGQKEESVVMISMDSRHKVLNTTRLFEGSVNSAYFSCRTAVQQALQDNATVVVIAHNHPNGFAFPSHADLDTTIQFAEVLASVDIRLADHIVVSEDDAVSMAATEAFAPIFDRATPLNKIRTLSQWYQMQDHSITGASFFQLLKSEETE